MAITDAELTYRQAVACGIAQEMERDPSVVMLGEDIGAAGGVFKTTEGLLDRFGPDRVRDTPISEQAIIGAAMGAAMTGLRPVAELMFSDFFGVAWDMIANQVAKTRYMTDGQVSLPLVIRTANGGGLRFGAQHCQSDRELGHGDPRPEGRGAVHAGGHGGADGRRHPRPRPGDLLRAQGAAWPTRATCPTARSSSELGEAQVVRAGLRCDRRRAGRHGAARGCRRPRRWPPRTASQLEVIDLRCLVPLDVTTVLASVSKTTRLFTVEENPRLCGWGAEVVSIVAEEAIYSPRRPGRADHHAARAARRQPGAGGRADAVGRADRRRSCTDARGHRRDDDRRASAPGGWDRRWPAPWRAAGRT